MAKYKITEVKFYSTDTYGKDGNHRVVVNFENEEKDFSAFVQNRPNAGDEWEGEIKKAEKNDKIYWNFEFPREQKTAQKSGGMSSIEYQQILRDLQAIKTDTQMIIGMIEKRMPTDIVYPDSVGEPRF